MQSANIKKTLFIITATISLVLVNIFLVRRISQPTLTDNADVEVIDEALMQLGVDVYLASYCGACHQLSLAETYGSFGPSHDQMRLSAEEAIASSACSRNSQTIEEYIRESIIEPQSYIPPGYVASSHAMPSFTHLPEEDINALVYMLSNQR